MTMKNSKNSRANANCCCKPKRKYPTIVKWSSGYGPKVSRALMLRDMPTWWVDMKMKEKWGHTYAEYDRDSNFY